jgi:hypothetical protein
LNIASAAPAATTSRSVLKIFKWSFTDVCMSTDFVLQSSRYRVWDSTGLSDALCVIRNEGDSDTGD